MTDISTLAELLKKRIDALPKKWEFIANITHVSGGTEIIIIDALSKEAATQELLELGFAKVNWVL